jgi:hypothetical protein
MGWLVQLCELLKSIKGVLMERKLSVVFVGLILSSVSLAGQGSGSGLGLQGTGLGGGGTLTMGGSIGGDFPSVSGTVVGGSGARSMTDGSLGGSGGTPAVMDGSIGGGGGTPALTGSGIGGGGLGLQGRTTGGGSPPALTGGNIHGRSARLQGWGTSGGTPPAVADGISGGDTPEVEEFSGQTGGGGGAGLCSSDAEQLANSTLTPNLAIVVGGLPAQVSPTYIAAISMQYRSHADVCEATED